MYFLASNKHEGMNHSEFLAIDGLLSAGGRWRMRYGRVPDLGKTNTVAIGTYHKIGCFSDCRMGF